MIRWLTPPKLSPVAKYVECYWFLEKTPDAEGPEYPKLNPDPSAHLIFSPPGQSYRYNLANTTIQGKGSHWLYPHCKTFELDHCKPLICLGVKFHVGALYSLDVEFSRELLDTVKAIGELNNQINPNENALIDIAKTAPDKCVEMLDDYLLPWLLHSHEDNHSQITRQMLGLLSQVTINELGKTLKCSQRTLERSFLRVTGLTLKQCQSMNKLEAILAFVYQREQSDIDWVDIAYQFGFSDQPHLIRYLKKQIDLTPKDYARQRGFTIDVYGGVDSR